MDTYLDRRNFLKITGLAGAGLALNGLVTTAFAQSGLSSNGINRVNGYFLPVILVDDVISIVSASKTIMDPIRHCLTYHTPRPTGRITYTDMARLGRVVRNGSDEDMIDLLDDTWSKWDLRHDTYRNEALPEKLAFISGWLMLRGLDHHLGEEYSQQTESLAGADRSNPSAISVYHDTHLLREFLISKQGEQAIDNINSVSVDDIEDAFNVIGWRSLIKIHTFEPDADDALNWAERLIKWHRSRADVSKKYAQAYHSPDPDLKRRYIDDFNFYDRENPIIKRARAFQNGTVLPIDFDLKAAGYGDEIHRFRGQSKYALAMADAWFNIKHLNAYLLRVISRNEFQNRIV